MTLWQTQPIPDRYRATCEFCNHELDIRANGVHQYTSGWVMNRTGGGGHGVSLPERSPRWAHEACITRMANGTFAQSKLFG